jgi:hypothetical protein
VDLGLKFFPEDVSISRSDLVNHENENENAERKRLAAGLKKATNASCGGCCL